MKKINLKNIDLKSIFSKNINFIAYTFIVIIFGFVGYFTYQNVYQSSISPKPIDQSEIIAKKQKVNLILFEKITNDIESKRSLNDAVNITNPFK